MAQHANRLSRLPSWISHWLGYRSSAPKPAPAYVVYAWSFIGAFCGLATIQAILYYGPALVARHAALVASFGASAVLCYGSIALPLAQPRNLVGGHFISGLIGVCVLKLFLLLPPERFTSLLWLSSSLATACAVVAMQATQTTHPPAGATALVPIVDEAMRELGWYYLPVVLLCSAIVLATACLLNNVQRQYPVYWITPNAPASPAKPTVSATQASATPTPVDPTIASLAAMASVKQSEPTSTTPPAAASVVHTAGNASHEPRDWTQSSISHHSSTSSDDAGEKV